MSESFRVGVNYWPASSAMRWWQQFDGDETARDFARMRASGGDLVRLFLLWEDFQPDPERVSEDALAHLLTVADLASANRLQILPTLFCGHMSGANFVPEWALGRPGGARFRTVANGRVDTRVTRNWYADDEIGRAQALLARECARALAGHPALWGWDLGNENSNCCIPASRELGIRWLERMAEAIRRSDPGCHLTLGLHMEDLQEDRRIGPAEAARVCDILCMHGYPMYCSWAAGPTDAALLGFLAAVTRQLGGRDVLFAEFGAATRSDDRQADRLWGDRLLDEKVAGEYIERAFATVHAAGTVGGLVWCFADYAERIWSEPPLDDAPHERHFGLWRPDGEPKPAASALGRWSGRDRAAPPASAWSGDLDPARFYDAPLQTLERLYGAGLGDRLARSVL